MKTKTLDIFSMKTQIFEIIIKTFVTQFRKTINKCECKFSPAVKINYIKRMHSKPYEQTHVSVTEIKRRRNMRDDELLVLLQQISLHEEAAAQPQVSAQRSFDLLVDFHVAGH